MKSIRRFAVLLLVPLASAAAVPAPVSPLFYMLAPMSNELLERLEPLGVWPPLGGDAELKARLLHPLACAGGQCRRPVEPPQTNDRKWTETLLALEPTRTGRFATIPISFTDSHLTVEIDLYDAKLADSGKTEISPRYYTMYNADCAHSADINSCLLTELGHAFERFAQFIEVRTNPDAWAPVSAKIAHRDQLPFARDLMANDDAVCRQWYLDNRVVKDFGAYLWLAFPPDFKNGADAIVIAARCPPQVSRTINSAS
jgi:hypothetical protein